MNKLFVIYFLLFMLWCCLIGICGDLLALAKEKKRRQAARPERRKNSTLQNRKN